MLKERKQKVGKNWSMGGEKIQLIVQGLQDPEKRTFREVAQWVSEKMSQTCTTEEVRRVNTTNRIRVHQLGRNGAMVLASQ